MHMRGATLLETIVVVAIITSLSLMGVNSINNFRKDTIINNIASELVSELRLARNKSINGELLEGEETGNFQENNFPEYGVKVNTDSYELVRRCVYSDGKICDADDSIEKISLDTDYELFPLGNVIFGRITGETVSTTLTIKEKTSGRGRLIEISNESIIFISKIE